ncbi:helix-turn-helix domain-containing protein [Rhizobium sp. NZLR11]|nr:helix-turn-helix domain-containing protein [Rhizobium sp. NZLR11]
MQLSDMAKSPITKYRANNGKMSLEDFGKLFRPAVDKSTVSRWERGQLPVRRVLEIEKVTGIDRRQLAPKMFKGLEAAVAGTGDAA